MAYPLYKYLHKKVRSETLAALILTICLVLIIVIPTILMGKLLINEATSLAENTQIENIEYYLEKKLELTFSPEFSDKISGLIRIAAGYVLELGSQFIFTIPTLVLNFFIMLFVFFYSFKDGEKLLNKIKEGLPLKESHKKRIEKKFATTVESLFYGEIAISLLEGVIATIGFTILGIRSPVLWGLITGLVALFPAIGPTLIWAPLALFEFLAGHSVKAVVLVLFGFFILSMGLDTIARAKILGLKGHIHPVIIIIGVLGGLALFGIVGLIVGPLILVLLELIAEMYLEEKNKI